MRITKTLFAIVLSVSAYAQEVQEKIETDRPDQTETPFTVPKGYFQAELGFNKVNYKGDHYELVHPTALLKYGLSKRLELRLEHTYKTEIEHLIPNDNIVSTLEPLEVGFKLALLEEKGIMPKLSLIAHAGLPFLASKHARPDQLPFIVRLAMQNSLTKSVALGYNIGIERSETDQPAGWFYTFAPGFEIGERWYAYVEVFGTIRQGELPDHAIDGGIAYFVSNNVKIDLSSGLGLSPESFKNYIALGVSFRLPLAK